MGNDWDGTDPSNGLVHQLFEQAAARDPDRVAVVCNGESLTYAELGTRVNQLARYLRSIGVGPDELVIIWLERGLDMVSAMLGVVKAGAAYVPLDPAYPEARLRLILQEVSARFIITQTSVWSCLSESGADVIFLDCGWFEACGMDGSSLDDVAVPDNLAYVIFTSGSTGTPKGVALPHLGLRDLLDWYGEHFLPGLTCLQFNSFSFDACFTDVFCALSSGGTAVIVPENKRRDSRALVELIEDGCLERLNLPTPLLSQLIVSLGAQLFRSLRSVKELWVAGDRLRLSRSTAAEFAKMSSLRIHNQYGPTETHVCTDYRLRSGYGDTTDLLDPEQLFEPPIGQPVANCEIFVLDPELHPVDVGVLGELCVGGSSLARGYVHQAGLTAERFVANPFSLPGQRLYRTGDLVRRRADGNLIFVGRVDDQVKVRGYRVEPGEIEITLMACPGVSQAAVIRCDSSGDVRLAAYLVIDSARCDVAAVRAFLAARLPDYMIPSWFVVLDTMPLTPSGKVDRSALPSEGVRSSTRSDVVEPVSVVEKVVAEIWREILGVDHVSATDNFFELGGDSLLIIELAERVRTQIGKDLRTSDVMNAPTVAALAALIERPTNFSLRGNDDIDLYVKESG